MCVESESKTAWNPLDWGNGFIFGLLSGEMESGTHSLDGASNATAGSCLHRHRWILSVVSWGSRYVVMFVDSASRLQRPYGAREKSTDAIFSVVKRFVADMGVTRAFCTDSSIEYSNSMFVDFCNGLRTRCELTAPYTLQQNGPVECAISRAFKAGHAARLGVPQLYLDIRLEEVRGCTNAARTSLWLESLL